GGSDRDRVPDNVEFDLVEEIVRAEVRQPTTLVDLGAPEAQPLMIQGWTIASREVPGGSARWTVGDKAELEFFVGHLKDLEVTFRCAPVGGKNAVTRDLHLEINEEPWDSVRLEPSLTVYRLILPAGLLRLGENRLRILHPAPQPTLKRHAKDVRVLWDFIHFENGENSSQEKVSTTPEEGGTLTIPMGLRVDYFLDLPAESSLTVSDLNSSRWPSDGHLRVIWEPADGSEPLVIDDFFDWRERSAELTSNPSSGRLSLHAVSKRADRLEPGAWMRLISPRVSRGGTSPSVPAVEDVKPVYQTSGSQDRPNIVVYLVDTLRADHLGCYGYSRDTSPNIDDFANEAHLFERAQAQSPWTRASVASILTGLWPTAHGAEDDPHALSDKVVTLAELLQKAGYQTAAVVANGNTTEATGFAQGFETFLYGNGSNRHAQSGAINASALEWLKQRDLTAPFFLYLHTVDPHSPYKPTEPFRSVLAPDVSDIAIGDLESLKNLNSQADLPAAAVVDQLAKLYDAEIAANDAT
ncbi:MAG: sulfatase, partial [Thermoanaerobaculia bacterium]